jgi:hypothetical protein
MVRDEIRLKQTFRAAFVDYPAVARHKGRGFKSQVIRSAGGFAARP